MRLAVELKLFAARTTYRLRLLFVSKQGTDREHGLTNWATVLRQVKHMTGDKRPDRRGVSCG